jgi:hypothetical protein
VPVHRRLSTAIPSWETPSALEQLFIDRYEHIAALVSYQSVLKPTGAKQEGASFRKRSENIGLLAGRLEPARTPSKAKVFSFFKKEHFLCWLGCPCATSEVSVNTAGYNLGREGYKGQFCIAANLRAAP